MYKYTMVKLKWTRHIDPVLAKRRSNVYDVGLSPKQNRRNDSFSPESNNGKDECQRWFIAGPTLETLAQHWSSGL